MSVPEDRLLREGNPTPGEKPGFIPQHRLQGQNVYEKTEGKNGHMNVRSDDGQLVTMGAKTDAVAGADLSQGWSLIALIKGLLAKLRDKVTVGISQVAGENVIKDADTGTKIDAAAMPAGGSGTHGWLSAIWTRLDGVVLAAGDAIIGRVKLTDGIAVASVDAATGGVKTLAQGITPVELKGSNTQQQPLITETMDFRGKTAGQTFDVPHISRYRASTAFDAPTSGAENSASGYTKLSVIDGQLDSSNASANGSYGQVILSFDLLNDLKIKGRIPASWDVAKLKANIKSISGQWIGYGVGSNAGVSANGAVGKLWLNGTTWSVALTPNTGSTPTASSFLSSNPAQYIDANGNLHLLVHTTHPSDGTIASTIYTDYVKLDVQLYGEMMLTDTARAWDQDAKALRVKSAGNNVEEIVVFNALAITDTGNKVSAVVDVSKYKQIFVFAYSTHNQDVKVYPQIDGGNIGHWNGGSWSNLSVAPAVLAQAQNGVRIDLNSFYSVLNRAVKAINFVVKTDVAPTSGSLTLKILGVPN